MIVQCDEQPVVQSIQSRIEVALHAGRADVLRPTTGYCSVTVVPMIEEEIRRPVSALGAREQAKEENIAGWPSESLNHATSRCTDRVNRATANSVAR